MLLEDSESLFRPCKMKTPSKISDKSWRGLDSVKVFQIEKLLLSFLPFDFTIVSVHADDFKLIVCFSCCEYEFITNNSRSV